MRLTCPTCQTGLEVPDGTGALVRCPACKGVFEPAAGLAPPLLPIPEPLPFDDAVEPPARPRREARPRRPCQPRAAESEPFETAPRSSFLRDKEARDAETAAENRETRRAFRRAGYGCRMVWWSLLLYGVSLMLIVVYFILTATSAGNRPGLVTAAGVLGLFNWWLALGGVGLIVSGPDRGGLRGYGIATLALGATHLFLMMTLVNKNDAFSEFTRHAPGDVDGSAQLPTKFVSLTAYLTMLFYQDQSVGPHGHGVLYVVVGVAELVRMLLLMLTLMTLARAAGDSDLATKCLRAGAIVTFVPGGMTLGMLGFTALMVETNLQHNNWGRIFAEVARMGTHAVLALMLIVPTRCARDTADACDAPILGRD